MLAQKSISHQLLRGRLHATAKNLAQALARGSLYRCSEEIKAHYDGAYARQPTGRQVLYRENGLWSPRDISSVAAQIQQLIGHTVEELAPSSILEVGCGSGRNLLYLHQRFPSVQCLGIDWAPIAVQRAKDCGVNAQVGAAQQLTLTDKSYDLVLTVAALEQMHTIRAKALTEISRVAKRWTLFYEPFGDAQTLSEWLYLWSKGYFRLPTGQLRNYGLTPVKIWWDLPRKPTFAYALVLCRVDAS